MFQANVISGQHSEFAIRLIDSRNNAKFTQQELADKVGIHKRNISLYENGHALPRGETVRKLATALDCDPDWLLNGITAATQQYLASQYKESSIVPRVDPLFIEDWTSLQKEIVHRPSFCEKPRYDLQISKADLFVHWVVNTLGLFRATRYPDTYQDNVEFPAGSLVIFDSGPITEQTLQNGSVVIFRKNGQNEPGLRRFVRDAGLTKPALISLNPALPTILYDRHDIELIGVVVGQVIFRKSLTPITSMDAA